MKTSRLPALLSMTVVVALTTATGCQHWKMFYQPPSAAPLGTLSDPVWINQETNAELADFVVYQHEFKKDTEYLNTAGEDHVRRIADRLSQGQDATVVVERSSMSARPNTEYQYPIHPNPALDLRRREIIVRSLTAMGIVDADNRVVVAPAFSQGYRAQEAEAAFRNGMNGRGGAGGFGGFGGGFGGGFF
jgi:hypothetical protein